MGLINHFKEAKEARKAKKAARAAREAEFPSVMSTMAFETQKLMPYTSSINYYAGFVPTDGVWEREVTLPSTILTQYEAQRIVTADGDRYQVYILQTSWPNRRPDKILDESAKLPNNDGTFIFTKEQALNYLKQLEQEALKTRNIAEDGAEVDCYFGRYFPQQEVTTKTTKAAPKKPSA